MGLIRDAHIEAIFFDAGNTVLRLDYNAIAQTVRRQLGLTVHEPTAGRIERAEHRARRRVDEAYRSHGATDERMWTRYFRFVLEELAMAPPLSELERDQILDALRREHDQNNLWRKPMPHARTLLESLGGAGITKAVISNSDGRVDQLLQEVGLAELLDGIHDSAVVGVEKPAPEIFEHAMHEHRSTPARSIYVGDLEHVDVSGARAAGMIPILVDPLPRQSADSFAVVANLVELEALLV